MILLTVNELKDEVDVDIVKKVTAVCDWQKEMRFLHDPIDADSTIAKMEGKIRRALKVSRKSERDLVRSVNAHRAGLWCYEAAKKNLKTSKEICWDNKKQIWDLTG